MSALVLVMIFLIGALVVLVVAWMFARRVKDDLDSTSGPTAGARAAITLAPDNVARLRELSSEPILIKRSDEGVRVQIDHRPMLPLMAFTGRDVTTALNEAAALVSQRWGLRWVALLTIADDGSVAAQRLS